MQIVLLTALGVGGATVFGTVLGFLFKNISHKFSDIVLSFAAGVMLSAAVLGLILPSVEYGGKWGLLITAAGIFCENTLQNQYYHRESPRNCDALHSSGGEKGCGFLPHFSRANQEHVNSKIRSRAPPHGRHQQPRGTDLSQRNHKYYKSRHCS